MYSVEAFNSMNIYCFRLALLVRLHSSHIESDCTMYLARNLVVKYLLFNFLELGSKSFLLFGNSVSFQILI